MGVFSDFQSSKNQSLKILLINICLVDVDKWPNIIIAAPPALARAKLYLAEFGHETSKQRSASWEPNKSTSGLKPPQTIG